MIALLYISLLQVDWKTINFIILTSLIGLMLILKLIEYTGRWGDARSSNIIYSFEKLQFNNHVEETFQNNSFYLDGLIIQKKTENIPPNCEMKTVLIITPFLVGLRRFNYFASAIAQKNYKIIMIRSSSLFNLIQKSSPNRKFLYLYRIIYDLNPDVIISFDYACGLIKSAMNKSDEIISGRKKCCFCNIRPIFDKHDERTLTRIPFSYQWFFWLFSILSGRKFQSKSYQNQNMHSLDMDSSNQKTKKITELVIYPSAYLPTSSYKYREISNSELIEFQIVNNSRFSFKHRETIVFGLIMRFIDEFFA